MTKDDHRGPQKLYETKVSVFRSNSDFSDLYTSIKRRLSCNKMYLQVQFRRQRHYQLK